MRTFDKKLPIQHIGIPRAICNRSIRASLREDLGVARYKRLGVVERFKDERPYRICKRCIKITERADWWPYKTNA